MSKKCLLTAIWHNFYYKFKYLDIFFNFNINTIWEVITADIKITKK